MKKLLILIPFLLNGASLKSILNHTQEANLVKIKSLQVEAKEAELKSTNAQNLPTVDLGAFVSNSNPRSPMQPGTTYGANVKLKYTIYSGGLKSARVKQKHFELASAKFEKHFFSKSLSLEIVKDYYNIKSLDALIESLHMKERTLKEQLKKIKLFVSSGLATQENIYSLQAAVELVKDNIHTLEFQRKSLLNQLYLKANYRFKSLGDSHFVHKNVKFRVNDLIKSLRMKRHALLSSSRIVESAKNLHINMSASYNRYGYSRSDRAHPKGILAQSKINLNAGIRLYDGGVTKEKTQAVKLQAISLGVEIQQKLQEQRMQYHLIHQKIAVVREHIRALRTQYKAQKSLFTTVKKEYASGLADYVRYLDALSQMVNAKANLAKAHYELEIAYALYYYNAGYNIKRFIK